MSPSGPPTELGVGTGLLTPLVLWRLFYFAVCELFHRKRKPAISSAAGPGQVGNSPRRSRDLGCKRWEDSYLSDKMNFPSLRLGSFLRGLILTDSVLWW